MRRLISMVLLVLLAWQSIELAWRRFVWTQDPPEVPLGACLFLLAINFCVLVVVSKRIFFSQPKFTT